MRDIYKISVGVLVVGVLLLSSMISMVSTAGRDVNFSLNISDPPGDVTGMNPTGQVADDTDITSAGSHLSGDDIVLELTVVGTIHDQSADGSYTYIYHIDTNADGTEDWRVSAVSYGTMTVTMSNPDTSVVYTDLNYTGAGTSTLSVSVPMEHFTTEITGWDMYVECTYMAYDSSNGISDQAPDDGFNTDPNADNDGDGMPNGWETENGLNPNDPTDASEDPDGDGFTNLEEYQGDSDPQDPSSHPPTLDTSIIIGIEKPTDGEHISASSTLNALYTAKGTVSPGTGGPINHVECRIPDSPDYDDWEWADDTSVGSDWSTWEFQFSISFIHGISGLNSGENTLEVRAVDGSDNYNTANVTFYFDTDTGGGSGGSSGGNSGSGGSTGGTGSGSSGSSGGMGDVYEEGPDPATQTPTDTSISVKITSATYNVVDNGDKVSFDYSIKGTTSGVDHCRITFISYYSDGTHDTKAEWIGPFDMKDNATAALYMKSKGYEELYFKATNSNWRTWEFKSSGTTDNSNNGQEGKTLVKTIIYVRAYSDASETNWNQASYTVTPGENNEEDNSNSSPLDSIPGFEAFSLVVVLGIAMLIWRRDRL